MLNAATVAIVPADPYAGGRETADELLDELGQTPDLVLLFASAEYPTAQVVAGMRSRLGKAVPLIGCSTFAEIGPEQAQTGSISAVGLCSTTLGFHPVSVADAASDSYAAGQELGRALLPHTPKVVLVFPDGLRANNSRLGRGLQDTLGSEVLILGGAAGDRGDFTKTFQVHNDTVLSGGAAAVGISGDVQVATSARSGWTPIGGVHTCTRVEGGNILRELDGKPALALYREYLGDRAHQMPRVGVEFPMGIVGGISGLRNLPEEPVHYLRMIVGVDEERQSLSFAAEIPEGAEVRVTMATPEDVIQAAARAMQEVRKAMPDPSLALFFNCMARKLVLGARYREELREPLRSLGAIPRGGFYTYGELAPIQGLPSCNNETCVIALIKG